MRKAVLVSAAALTALLGVSACGSSKSTQSSGTNPAANENSNGSGAGTSDSTPGTTAAPVPTRPPVPKPSVKIPASLPTTLQINVLQEGTGTGAVAGDQVVVHYLGVRSKDGKEFDNSYDRGEPFAVDLGAGKVIKGWDQGLLGAKAGSRIQLDIPSELAYGAQSQGDVIGENEALTFVIDVLAVIPKNEAGKEPVIIVKPSKVADVSTVDLVPGTGAEATSNQTVTFNYIFYRGDTGEKVFSSWSSSPASIPLIPDGNLDGLIKGLIGMKVGGRRQITVPPAQIFGGKGQTSLNLPAGVDVVMVADLLAVY